jgi:hypothetical protein
VEWGWGFLNSGVFAVTMVRRIMHQVQISSFGASDNVHFYCTTLSQAVTLRLVVSQTVNIDVRSYVIYQ